MSPKIGSYLPIHSVIPRRYLVCELKLKLPSEHGTRNTNRTEGAFLDSCRTSGRMALLMRHSRAMCRDPETRCTPPKGTVEESLKKKGGLLFKGSKKKVPWDFFLRCNLDVSMVALSLGTPKWKAPSESLV